METASTRRYLRGAIPDGCFACRICRRQILGNAQEMDVAQSLRIMRVYFRTPDGCSGWPRGSKVGWRNSECYGQPGAPRDSQRIDVLQSHPGGSGKLDVRPRLIEPKEQLSPTYPWRLHMIRKAKAVW